MESKIALKSKIKELERIIEQIINLASNVKICEENCKQKDKEIALLNKKLKGDRVCTGYCRTCKHAIDNGATWYMGVFYPNDPLCDLECKCKDFERK